MPVLRPGLPIRPPLGPLLLRVLLFVPDMWGVVQKGRVGTEQLLCSSGETTWNIIGQNGPPRTPYFAGGMPHTANVGKGYHVYMPSL